MNKRLLSAAITLIVCYAHAHDSTHAQQTVTLTSLGGNVSVNCTPDLDDVDHVTHWMIPPGLMTVDADYTDEHTVVRASLS